MIVIGVTTFNRCHRVARAIETALAFAHQIGGKVVLVDDASTDGTVADVTKQFAAAIASGSLAVVAHTQNLGVTGAKNTCFAHATGANWVLFLDSDDELMGKTAKDVANVLERHRDAPVVFFRCIDQAGRFVGRRFSAEQELTVARYAAHTSYGEALVAINRRLAAGSPFDTDLRGYEGLGCVRLIRQFGPAVLSTVVARRYDRSGSDRLSSMPSMLARAHLLARGHIRYLSVVRSDVSWFRRMDLRVKAWVYLAAGGLYGLLK